MFHVLSWLIGSTESSQQFFFSVLFFPGVLGCVRYVRRVLFENVQEPFC